jgi:cytochrome c biogenesis protein CcmG/thiol:disulfide interchange protein DsbE
MRKLQFFIPLALFLGLAVFLFSGLFSNPRDHGSALVTQPIPVFSLPELNEPTRLVTHQDLKGKVYLLNVWGTWCATCNAELGFLTKLRQQGINIIGLYYVQPADAAFGEKFEMAALQQEVARKLAEQGDPYQFNIVDEHRSLIFDLGVTGAPETFLVDAQGVIRHHLVGDINEQNWPELSAKYAALTAPVTSGGPHE